MNQEFPAAVAEQVTLENWRTAPFNQWAFHHVSEIVPSAVIENDPARTGAFTKGSHQLQSSLPDFEYNGENITAENYIRESCTDGLIVLQGNELLHESYPMGMPASSVHILMSISKSMLGLLVGILVEEGVLDLQKPVEHYLPELASSAFASASLQQLLDMRTGIAFDEDYLATEGKIIEYRKATNWNPLAAGETPGDLRSFFATLTESDGPHGGVFDYKSPCTDLLGWVCERASGERYADLFSRCIWKPMGAERPAMITVDRLGAPRVAGGVSMTTRDLARVGQLMANSGDGIVPASWVEDIETGGDAEAWDNGSFASYFPGISMHYRSKWYVMRGDAPILFCLGIHGQNLFVDRRSGIVMAKHASAAEPLDTDSELKALRLFEAIRNSFS